MSDMKISTLSVDLLQENATISLFNPGVFKEGKNSSFSVNVSVPLNSAVNRPEGQLKQHAISAARKTLEEAIRVLDNYAV